jgi:hypothetical protein
MLPDPPFFTIAVNTQKLQQISNATPPSQTANTTMNHYQEERFVIMSDDERDGGETPKLAAKKVSDGGACDRVGGADS